MKFTQLSEEEILAISKILDQEKINYQIEKDDMVEQANATSLKNNLRYQLPPSISLNIFAITIEEHAFADLSKEARSCLEKLGIVNIDNLPSEMDFKNHSTSPALVDQGTKVSKRKTMEALVHKFSITLILILLCVLIYRVFMAH